MIVPDTVASRLKPGVMFRKDDPGRAMTLYEPISDLTVGLVAAEGRPGELELADLDSDDRAWRGGRLDANLYHACQRVRTHVDATELNFEINYACGYACRHCFQNLVPEAATAATPDWAELERAALGIAALKPREVSITGGDIFLHPRVHDAVELLLDRLPTTTFRILVSGGALDLDDPAVRGRLAGWAGRRVIVKSDFFSHRAALHDHFTRVPGSFEKLVRIVRSLSELGVTCLPAGAITRWNFETRFELVGFLEELTEDRFTISTIVYPTNRRTVAELAGARLTSPQWRELMDERFFAPLAAEYHTFEGQCESDCQFAVVSAEGRSWGCSFFRSPDQALGESRRLPLAESIAAWRSWAAPQARHPDCPSCPARATCRRCPSFLGTAPRIDDYCGFSRDAQAGIAGRIGQARARGFRFLHAEAETRASVESAGEVAHG